MTFKSRWLLNTGQCPIKMSFLTSHRFPMKISFSHHTLVYTGRYCLTEAVINTGSIVFFLCYAWTSFQVKLMLKKQQEAEPTRLSYNLESIFRKSIASCIEARRCLLPCGLGEGSPSALIRGWDWQVQLNSRSPPRDAGVTVPELTSERDCNSLRLDIDQLVYFQTSDFAEARRSPPTFDQYIFHATLPLVFRTVQLANISA